MNLSKELLSEVLGREVKGEKGKIFVNSNNITFSFCDEDLWSDINTCELVFMIKDFLKTKSKYLDLNQDIDDIFKEANSLYQGIKNE